MMVLVDTTVWIDFFGDRAGPHLFTLQELIDNDEDFSYAELFLPRCSKASDPTPTIARRRTTLNPSSFCPCDVLRLSKVPRYTAPCERRESPSGNPSTV